MQIIERSATATEGTARVRFAADDPVFAGHFPAAPVLPGVVLIDRSVSLVALAIDKPLRLESLKNVKFIQAVAPGDIVDLAFTLQAIPKQPTCIRARVHWSRDSERIAEMTWQARSTSAKGASTS